MVEQMPDAVAAMASAVANAEPRAVVLVEGRSDRAAVLALARRRGRDLDSDGVAVVAMGGVTNLRHYLSVLGGTGVRLAGLYDEAATDAVRRSLRACRIATSGDTAAQGFHVCRRDLEDELLGALGVDAVLQVFECDGELDRFRLFQRQPAQRGRPIGAHLHRFLGIRSGRKIRYGRLLVEALDLERVPAPLDAVLGDV